MSGWLPWRDLDPGREATRSELARLERLVHRMWQILCLSGVVGGVAYAVAVSVPLGLGSAATAAALLVWFVTTGYLHDRGNVSRAWVVANTLVEACIPWAFLLVIAFARGADYAIASWVAPFLFCTCIVSYVPRLKPARALAFGAAGGVFYAVLYFAVLEPRLPMAVADALVYQPATQVSRSIAMVGAGVVASLFIVGLRHVIGATPAPADDDLVLGRYRIRHPSGQGALGETFVADNRDGNARVRLEICDPSHGPELGEKLALAVRLTHPNLVRVFDFGHHGSRWAFVSELSELVTVGELLGRAVAERRFLPPEVVTHVGLGVLDAFEHVRNGALDDQGRPLGLVHGALGPSSVQVTELGEVKLADLVLPTPLASPERVPPAPELERGSSPTLATDLYALGGLLWELSTGERRRPGGPVVPLSSLRPELDAGWNAFFLRALAPEPTARFATPREMATALALLKPRRDDARLTLAALAADVRNDPSRARR